MPQGSMKPEYQHNMDRPIDAQAQRKRKLKKYARWLLALLAVAVALWLFRRAIRPQADTAQLRIATVETGNILQTVVATGTVVATFEEQLNAPVATTIRQIHLTTGSEVKQGDLILSLDQAYVQLQLDSRRDQLALRKNNVALLKLEYERDIKELAFNTQIKDLELSTAEAQLADTRRLLKIGGATEEEVERAELQLRITQLERDKLNNELAYRRASLSGRKNNLELEVAIEDKEVAQLSRKLNETAVRAPRPGVVTWLNEKIGQQVAEGAPLVRIADLGHFRMEATCSDRYADQLSLGQPVRIRLAKATLNGTISAILPEVEDNTLKFLVEFEQPNHPALRPNLKAETEVVTGEKAGVLRVKNGPAFRGGIRQKIYVLRGQEAIATEVTLGMRSSEYIEIRSENIRPGDRIVISDTAEFQDRASITLQ